MVQSLRIAIFTFSYAPVMTGIATGVHTRVRGLLENGHRVLLVHPEIDWQYSDEVRNRSMAGVEAFCGYPNFSSRTYPTKPHFLEPSHPEPRRWRSWSDSEMLEGFRPDVVLVEEAAGMQGFTSVLWGGYGKPVGAEYCARTGTPTVSMFEMDFVKYAEYYFGRYFLRALRPLLRYFVAKHSRAYTTTFFPSTTMLQRYHSVGMAPSEHLVFHGIDCEEYRPENICHDPIPGDDRPLILFVGRVAREKNLTVLFRAFAAVLEAIPNAHLAIVGNGSGLERARRALSQFGSSATVVGASFGDALKGWYARADVFVNPSVSENFCTTNLEALASGTPTVAADAGGNGEQVIPSVNGLLAKPNCARSLAAQTIRILQCESYRQQLGRGARTSALNYDTAACTQRLETALHRLVRTANADKTIAPEALRVEM